MSSTVHHLNTEVTPRRMDPVPAAPPPPHQHDTVSDGPDGDTPEATGHDDNHTTAPASSGSASFLTPIISRYEALTPRQKLYGGSGLGICAVLLVGILATSGHHHRAVSAPGQEVGMDQSAAPVAQAPEPAPVAAPPATADLAEMQTLGHPKAAASPPDTATSPKAPPAAVVATPSAASQSASAQPDAPRTEAPAVVPPAPPADPVKTAQTLQAAPMATQQQIDVLQLVTAEARVIERERGEVEELRQSLAGQRKAEEDRLNDLTRRVSLVEANHAVTGAENSGADEAAQAHAAAEKARAALSAAMNKPATVAATSSAAPPAPAAVAGPAPKPEWVHHYRIVAASPQLAMIEDSAAPSGQARQFEVGVGTVIPGYGAVLTISQQGATWVLHTAHGDLN
ncbi:hypothetical protein JK203_13730 [Gluconobacter cerinus]|uniref:Uncharacterized protein n=1 Tax=Gluconobacter cerinus TaxID=38307 RepID=A0A1B6VPR8_9PROT|nr:hypothetical protein [Gluconobacter cerinus]MBS1041893.1 hypothetical protein [Gluconobacter cerinus]MBS1048481.1 hypothetical protein [Gluconobacter cerinus]OAJ69194.1 hypothetical protein A0123_00248 [Gluconobacter cerinus]GLQ64130.1 hypothetical protein GCM10007867_29760 [Gluconobacter cerinus]